jgi:hypothetical protein
VNGSVSVCFPFFFFVVPFDDGGIMASVMVRRAVSSVIEEKELQVLPG